MNSLTPSTGRTIFISKNDTKITTEQYKNTVRSSIVKEKVKKLKMNALISKLRRYLGDHKCSHATAHTQRLST
jgi:hypothetical protein